VRGRSDLTVGVVLPDVLGTYSDAGNAVVLAERARWRGIDATIVDLPSDGCPATGCDVYLVGGGEDLAQRFAADWLRGHDALLRAMTTSSVTFAVCAGLQILGVAVTDASGHTRPGAGVLDVTTTARTRRAVGEVVARPTIAGVDVLTGFENHRGGTTLGPSVSPLAVVERGVGNGARDGDTAEGAVSGHVLATYLHGPVLARNPTLADHVLRLATGTELAAVPEPEDLSDLRRTYLSGARRRRRR
jgi:lipid II isoglutaminyl synthase (glutamine-hydrolysing)